MRLHWIDGFRIEVSEQGEAVLIAANKEGLLSLANHLMELAITDPGAHFHLDSANSLEDGSLELIVEKKVIV